MLNVINILFDTFFALCGGCIGSKINHVSMFFMSFIGAIIGETLWMVIVEVLC